jgi:branched-chain amino acid transport system ATP-binding protein
MMLRVEGLEGGYGRSQVLFDVALRIEAGQLVTLLGRNGMGKTTTVRSIMGLIKPSRGLLEFDGHRMAGMSSEAIARLGIGLVPEGRQVFPTLTTHENLIATAANRLRHREPWTLDRIYELFPRLAERRNQMANTLSGGEQQMLAIGRALMTNPRLLILDEATEGLAPVIRRQIWACLELLKGRGLAILAIDKNLDVLKRLADRHFIIEKGRTAWTGTSADICAAEDVVRRYVGV